MQLCLIMYIVNLVELDDFKNLGLRPENHVRALCRPRNDRKSVRFENRLFRALRGC